MKSKLQNRVELLEKSLLLLRLISIELKYRCLPLDQMIINLCKSDDLADLSFLTDCKNEFENGNDFDASWKKSVESFSSSLKNEDKQVLIVFGSQLGKSDVESQLGICDMYSLRLEEKLKQAQEERQKYGKLYYRLGFLAGLFIMILFV